MLTCKLRAQSKNLSLVCINTHSFSHDGDIEFVDFSGLKRADFDDFNRQIIVLREVVGQMLTTGETREPISPLKQILDKGKEENLFHHSELRKRIRS